MCDITDEEQEQAAAAMADVSNRQARWVRLKHASIDKLQEMGADGKGSGRCAVECGVVLEGCLPALERCSLEVVRWMSLGCQ